MASNNYTIAVDVALRAKQQNIKDLRSNLENQFKDIDFDSSIGKKLLKLFDQFDDRISNMDSILGKGFLNINDVNRLEGIFNRINLIVGKMYSNIGKAPLIDLGIDASTVPELVAAREEVKKLTAESIKLRAKSTGARLKETQQEDLLARVKSLDSKSFDEQKSLEANTRALEAELEERRALIARYEQQKTAITEQQIAKQQQIEELKRKKEKQEDAAVEADQAIALKRVYSGKYKNLTEGKKNSAASMKDFVKELMEVQNLMSSEIFTEGSLTKSLADQLFNQDEILKMKTESEQAGQEIGEVFYKGLLAKMDDSNSRKKAVDVFNQWKNAHNESEAVYERVRKQSGTEVTKINSQIVKAQDESNKLDEDYLKIDTQIIHLTNSLNSFENVINELGQAARELKEYADREYKDKIADASNRQQEVRDRTVEEKYPRINPPNDEHTDYLKGQLQGQADADNFKKDLQQSIRQWMSIREVVGLVKQGIRQAYQDIQGLDKAMTNIAVVTDFSVSDLWGKINEYMSIAQQYGVTTQGVYEVSQLYFQQGLGEADTMAATVETLKMARIAGMDYAEAADGMTVAIRGFDMEMQDAAHVTDVYSKVAAITASDTQELVTAMSKTASSAAAVGSSFENTTAMLAVMIEATRESPQNLGSALKSIISRYGEMTKGLSEDSEGEEIDYNRVDAALKTVGISLKDAQGQFRDFDTVIEELSGKWDTLDSVTQRYIATIFAGNRQQSRFLALVSNYDRYMEVSEAAANSEDAGLLQYSKTLDSLETKLNNIKTSFQQFYMSLIDGPTIGAALDFVNNLIKGFNKLSKFTTILNIGGIISGIKVLGNLFVNTFSSGFSNISATWKATLQEMVIASKKAGAESKIAYNEGQNTVPNQAPNQKPNKPISKSRALVSAGLSIGGAALSSWGSAVAQENQTVGAWLSGAGSGLSTAGLALSLGAGGWVAGLAGAVVALVSAISSIPTAFEEAQQKVEKQQEVVNQKNIERAQAKEDYKNLTDYYQKLQDLETTRFDSTENQKEWLELNNQIVESYPQLINYYDLEGNAIVDLNAVQQAALESKDELIKKNREYYESEIKLNDLNRDKTLGEIGTSSIGKMSSAYTYMGDSPIGAVIAGYQQGDAWTKDQERFASIISQGGLLGEFFKKQFETLGAQKITGQTLLDIINEQEYSLSDLTSSVQKNANIANLSNLSQDSTALDYFAFVLKELGLFNIKDGEVSVSKTLLDLFDISQFDRTAKTFSKGYASQIVSTELLGKEEIIVEELSGVEKLFSLRLENLYNAAKQAGELEEGTTYTDWLAQDQSSQIQNALNEWNIWYGGLTNKQQELIHNLLNAPKTISIDELGELPQEGAPTEEIKDSWYSSIVPEYYRLIGALVGTKSDLGGEDLLDFKSFVESERINEYAEGTGSQEEAYYDYLQSWIEEQIDGSKESLTNILLQGNIEDIDEYNKFIQEQDAIIEKTAEGTSANRAALEKKKFVTEKLNQILAARAGDEESPFFKIIEDAEAMGELLSLLFSEDAGTFEWEKQFNKFKNKYDIQGLEDINLVMYEHANTMFSNYQSNFEQYQDSIEKLYSSQTDGWSEVESISYAKKQGKDWTELFEVKNNKIALKDFEAALSDAQNVYIQPLKDFQSYGEKAVSVLKTLDGQGIVSDSELDENLLRIEGIQNFIDSYTQLSSKEIIANAKEWANLGDNEDLTWDQLISYLQENYAEINTAFIEAMQKRIQEEAAQALRIAERTSELQGSLEDQNKQEAYSMLSSKGLTGYTEGEIAQLEEYLGVGKGGLGAVETGEGTGEYRIDQSKLAELPQWVQTAIWNIINDSTQSSLDEIAGLGAEASKIGGADKGVYVSAFEKYAKRFGAEWTENYVPSLIEGATAESYSDAAKYGSFTNRLKNLIKQENPEATDEEIEEKTRELINGYKDGLKEAEEEIIDLKLDALEKGFISASDKETLKEVDINFAQSFDEAIAKTGIERAQAIYNLIEETLSQKVSSGLMTELEKIEELGKTSSKQFQTLYQEELKNAYFEEAKTSIIEGDRILSFDELGKLQVASGKSLEDFYSKYIKGITETGEAILNIPAMFADGIITDKQYAQFQRNFAEETFGSAEDLITRMASKDDVYADEIESFFEALGAPLQEGEAELLLQSGVQTFLSKIESTLLAAGVPQSDIDSRLAEIQAQLIDLLLESISSGISSLGEGIEGTLGAADYQSLAKKYGLTGVGTSKSSKGIRLGAADQQKLISRMFLDAQNAGMESDFGEQIWEVYRDSQEDAIDGYTAIEKEIARVKGEHKELTGEALAYVEALQQARHSAMFDENAYEFAFMEQDATSGLTKNFDNFASQIDKVKEAFASFQNDEAIGYQDFYNMMDFIGSSEAGFAKFSEMTGIAASDYEAFVNSVVANTDEWGKVDIGGVAAEMGISVDAAMSAMSESMTEGLKNVARQQIKYLGGLEQMLMALAALEGIGSVDLSLGVDINGDGGIDANDSLTQIADNWSYLSRLPEYKRIEIEAAVGTKLRKLGSSGLNDIFASLGLGDSFIDTVFGTDGFQLTQAEVELADFWGTFADSIPDMSHLTEGQAMTVAEDMHRALQPYLDFDDEGNFIGFLDGYQEALGNFISNYNFTGVQESLNRRLEEAIRSSGGQPLSIDIGAGSPATISISENGLIIQLPDGITPESLTTEQMEALRSGLSEQLGHEVGEITIGENGELSIRASNLGTTEATEQLNRDFSTAAAAADTLQTAITNITSAVSSFQAGTGFQSLADQLGNAAGAAQALVAALYSMGALNFGNMGSFGLPNGANQQATPQYLSHRPEQQPSDTSSLTSGEVVRDDGKKVVMQGEVEITEANVQNLPEPEIEATASITNADTSNVEQPVVEAQGKITYENDSEAPEAPELEDTEVNTTYNIEQEGTVPPLDDQEPEVDYDIEQNGSAPPMGDGEYTIKYNIITNGVSPAFTGTVNAITGPAYADGSIGRIYSGAQLANKTLVGELGPELAVYNGQYHLLGQTGAEFVKLPKSAIVFNHLQTRGILSGQMKDARGLPMEPTAFATGNVTGPALAGGSGIGAALAAVRRAKSVWEGLLSSLTASDLLDNGGGGGGGGGGDESLKAHIADLQEWYNLSRQIADIEGQINILLAKRKSLTDGHEYLKNLRATQKLLEDQVNTQEDLLRFQELQLQRQAEHINTHNIWSQFLEVDENGLLQYIEGNETNGGKGALEVLQRMNEMTGAEQVAYVKSLGYTYEPPQEEGEEVDEEEREKEIVAKFYEELQKQIDDYDALRDTVVEAEEAMANLEEEIRAIDQEIRENEIDLSQEIYDIIVKAWEENIANLKEQNDLIKEANEAYANGIQEAIDAERQLYEQNTAISDREQLQRQLALMRRSGGSASEIADLEQQLNDMLKEEYFSNQEKQLETIQKANERQVELMDQQVKLQEEALEYEKENGIIWTKVYEVMQGTDAEILSFMQGNSTDFFQKSFLAQEDQLTEWSKKIGIFNEEKVHDFYEQQGQKTLPQVWETEEGKAVKNIYDEASQSQKDVWIREYNDQYADAIMEGKSETEAVALAQKELLEHIENYKKALEDAARQAAERQSSGGGGSNGGGNGSSGPKYQGTTLDGRTVYGNSVAQVEAIIRQEAFNTAGTTSSMVGYAVQQQYGTIKKRNYTGTVNDIGTARYRGTLMGEFGPELAVWNDKWHLIGRNGPEMRNDVPSDALIFNHLQTAGILQNQYSNDFFSRKLSDIPNSINSAFATAVGGISNNNESSNITIQPGAIVLEVQQLNNKYDVDELFNDVTDRLYSIAARASGRGVSRR